MKKLFTMTLAIITAVSLAACGGSAQAADTTAEAAETAESIERAEWSLTDIAALSDIARGITDRCYAANVGANYVIYEDVSYDHDIVCTVLFNTASVRFDTPGEYGMTYWIYFDTAALTAWADENGVSLDIPDEGRLAVWVPATVTVTAEDELSESDEDAETDDALAVSSSGSSTTAGSAKSAQSSTSNSAAKSSGSAKSSSSCNHNWVATMHEATGHYESVLVQKAYDSREKVGSQYVCNRCGYASTNGTDVADHALFVCGGGYHAEYIYETIYHDAVYETQWVQDTAAYTTYKCSKCGATK